MASSHEWGLSLALSMMHSSACTLHIYPEGLHWLQACKHFPWEWTAVSKQRHGSAAGLSYGG